jgi:hypothetical protein
MPEAAVVGEGVPEISPAKVMEGACVAVWVENVEGTDVITTVVWFDWAVWRGGGGGTVTVSCESLYAVTFVREQ